MFKKTNPVKTIGFTIFALCLFLWPFHNAEASSELIAVASTGTDKDAQISQVAGRAPFFLIFDKKGNFKQAHKNPAHDQAGGISRTVSIFLLKHGVSLFIAAEVGPKMNRVLNDNNISIHITSGVADDAVQSYLHTK